MSKEIQAQFRERAKKIIYPMIGYDEFCMLYNSGNIENYYIDGGYVHGMDTMEAVRKTADECLNRLASAFIKAYGRDEGIGNLNKVFTYKRGEKGAPPFDAERELAERALSAVNYAYRQLAVIPSQPDGPARWIGLTGQPAPEGYRRVLWEPEKFALNAGPEFNGARFDL